MILPNDNAAPPPPSGNDRRIAVPRDTAPDKPPPNTPKPTQILTLAEHIFAEAGVLQNALALEHRPQQERMALATAAAMKSDTPLLFEAGTGTGKTLAYLLPGIIHSIDQTRQLIVSTHTIALQEQLEQKDIPLCRKILAADPSTEKYAAFKSTVLVGKNNYLCTTRLAAALAEKTELFATAEHTELQRIADWAATTQTGLRHELNPPPDPEIWEHINADSSACSRKYCDCEQCHYQRARARIRTANLIIVNHSLLFSHINAGGALEKGATRGILYPDDFLVLDEAHTIPEVATEYFGIRLSSYGLNRLLKYLYNPRKKRGLLRKIAQPGELQTIIDAQDAATQFFQQIEYRLLSKTDIVRIREPDPVEPLLDQPLLALHKILKKHADKLDEGKHRDELLDQAAKIHTTRTTLRQYLSLSAADDYVHWVEHTGRRHTNITLRTAPIDIAPHLRETLLERQTTVLFTSATLALAGNMTPYQQRTGTQHTRAEIEHSPFDYQKNLRTYIATDIPLPNKNDNKLPLEILTDYIDFCTRRTRGGSLVLFTSYADMRQVAATLAPIYDKAHRPFLMQGDGLNRTELARQLRAEGNAILFGTDSFWTGIDIPGDALSQVIITRLPFEVPTHPILEARTEHIRERGGNPFSELTLPDALIKFRQGAGRLIRTAKDRGVITILDSRIVQKPYGRHFIGSLPKPDHTRITQHTRLERFQPYV